MSRLSDWLREVSAYVATRFKKSILFLSTLGAWILIGWFYDNPLWFLAINSFGPVDGNIIMSFGALIINLCALIFYVWSKKDWLTVDVLALIKGNIAEEKGFFQKIWNTGLNILVWCLENGGNTLSFFALSIFGDSFLSTVYLRHGDLGSLKKKDFVVFFSSTVVSCLYWSLRNLGIFELGRYLINLIINLSTLLAT